MIWCSDMKTLTVNIYNSTILSSRNYLHFLNISMPRWHWMTFWCTLAPSPSSTPIRRRSSWPLGQSIFKILLSTEFWAFTQFSEADTFNWSLKIPLNYNPNLCSEWIEQPMHEQLASINPLAQRAFKPFGEFSEFTFRCKSSTWELGHIVVRTTVA